MGRPATYTLQNCIDHATKSGGECLSTEYGAHVPMQWKCANGHVFSKKYYKMIGKPFCNSCRGLICENEYITRFVLETLTGLPFNKIRLPCMDGLEFDCYNEALNLGVEYNGKQHYEFTKRFHSGSTTFEVQLARDAKKRDLCAKNNI